MFRKKLPPIRYLWVGPPSPRTPNTSQEGIVNHDVECVLQMAEANKENPIQFWCLEKYEKEYKEFFKQKKFGNIEVCAIEKDIRKKQQSPYDGDVIRASKVMESILQISRTRNKVRDKVNIKNAFSTFLLSTEGGFILDTNNKPYSNSLVLQPPQPDVFHLPKIRDDELISDFECWAMYAPESVKFHLNQDAVAQQAFNKYAEGFFALEENFKEELENKGSDLNIKCYSEGYHEMAGKLIISSLVGNYSIMTIKEMEKLKFWSTIAKDGGYLVPALGIHKAYYNTHKPNKLTKEERFKKLVFYSPQEERRAVNSEKIVYQDEGKKEVDWPGDKNLEDNFEDQNNYNSELRTSVDKGESAYKEVLSILKTYIQVHHWDLGIGGGKEISFGVNVRKVPNSVYHQWSLIDEAFKKNDDGHAIKWKEVFRQVRQVGADAYEKTLEKLKEKKAGQPGASSLLKFINESKDKLFGRKEDTIDYLQNFYSLEDTQINDYKQRFQAALDFELSPTNLAAHGWRK